MSTSASTRSMAEDHRRQTEENARKLGSLETEVSGIKGDLATVRDDMRSNFAEIFRRLERAAAPRATPWGAVAVLVTVLLALAAWGNAWVSQAINGVRMSSEEALKKGDMNNAEIHSLQEKLWQREIDAAERRGRNEEKFKRLEDGKASRLFLPE